LVGGQADGDGQAVALVVRADGELADLEQFPQ
jgi:hypothetical protein